MTLEEFAKGLKSKLMLNTSSTNIMDIVNEIEHATHNDGSKLSKEEKERILDYIQYDRSKDGHILMKDSDNSLFLKAVSKIKSLLEDGGNN